MAITPKLIIGAVVITALTGCMSFREHMVHANGTVKDCSTSGGGIGLGAVVGVAAAAASKSSCVDQLSKLGYIKASEAGDIGISFENQDGKLVVSWLSKSIKDSGADVKIGDELVAIDGKTPSGVTGANTLLFGKADTVAMVKLKRNGKDMEIPVTRVQKSS